MLISLTLGNETYRNPDRSIRIAAAYRKTPFHEAEPLQDAARDPNSGIRLRNTVSTPASNVNPAHGQWAENSYEVSHGGNVLLLYVTISGEEFPQPALYVLAFHMRETAALNRFGITLTRHPRAVRSRAYLEGRFDFISPDDYDLMCMTFPIPVASYPEWDDILHSHQWSFEELQGGERFNPNTLPVKTPVATRTGKVVQLTGGPRRIIRLRRDE